MSNAFFFVLVSFAVFGFLCFCGLVLLAIVVKGFGDILLLHAFQRHLFSDDPDYSMIEHPGKDLKP